MSVASERVASLLSHYIGMAFRASGLGWDSDNESEMEGLAEAIVEVAAEAVREHVENEPHLHPDGSRS